MKSNYMAESGIRIATSLNGCKGCIYKRDGGAKRCDFANLCMAHMRKDRRSIIFTRK